MENFKIFSVGCYNESMKNIAASTLKINAWSFIVTSTDFFNNNL